jgi:hypothetical protein
VQGGLGNRGRDDGPILSSQCTLYRSFDRDRRNDPRALFAAVEAPYGLEAATFGDLRARLLVSEERHIRAGVRVLLDSPERYLRPDAARIS